MLGKPFNKADRDANGGESPYLFGYPDDNDLEASPYYWWFQYLKRHEGYLACCERNGFGEYSELYLDWGDVRTNEFDDWFEMYGGVLFKEPYVPDALTEIKSTAELGGVDWNSVMVVVSPIRIGKKTLSKRDIKRQFAMMVDDRFPKKAAGRPLHGSAAKYRIANYPNLNALKEILCVYDLHKAEPKLKQWQIGERLYHEKKLTITKNAVTVPSEPLEFGRVRNIMTAAIGRHLKIARSYIANSVGPLFPVK